MKLSYPPIIMTDPLQYLRRPQNIVRQSLCKKFCGCIKAFLLRIFSCIRRIFLAFTFPIRYIFNKCRPSGKGCEKAALDSHVDLFDISPRWGYGRETENFSLSIEGFFLDPATSNETREGRGEQQTSLEPTQTQYFPPDFVFTSGIREGRNEQETPSAPIPKKPPPIGPKPSQEKQERFVAPPSKKPPPPGPKPTTKQVELSHLLRKEEAKISLDRTLASDQPHSLTEVNLVVMPLDKKKLSMQECAFLEQNTSGSNEAKPLSIDPAASRGGDFFASEIALNREHNPNYFSHVHLTSADFSFDDCSLSCSYYSGAPSRRPNVFMSQPTIKEEPKEEASGGEGSEIVSVSEEASGGGGREGVEIVATSLVNWMAKYDVKPDHDRAYDEQGQDAFEES